MRDGHVTGVQTCALPIYPEHSFALLFVSGSDPCGNCFNEISDYLNLAAETPALMDNHYSMLLFHGNDESQARRYVQASGMTSRVDHSTFIETVRSEERRVGKECRCRRARDH